MAVARPHEQQWPVPIRTHEVAACGASPGGIGGCSRRVPARRCGQPRRATARRASLRSLRLLERARACRPRPHARRRRQVRRGRSPRSPARCRRASSSSSVGDTSTSKCAPNVAACLASMSWHATKRAVWGRWTARLWPTSPHPTMPTPVIMRDHLVAGASRHRRGLRRCGAAGSAMARSQRLSASAAGRIPSAAASSAR